MGGISVSNIKDLNPAWLDVAKQAAEQANDIAMRFFNQGVVVETKADDSPVTEADRACERAIRKTIGEAFPEHAIVGEEYGGASEGRHVWLIDPIDGTRSFIRGLPFWSIQIALMVEGELVLGVSSAPAFNEMAFAMRGQGAHVAGQLAEIRWVDDLTQADVSMGNIRSLARSQHWPWLGQVVEKAARTRGYGDFYSYHRLASGQQDVVIESDVNILDIAALTVIVQEAGGIVTDLAGEPIGLHSTSVLAASPPLHAKLLADLLSF